jgi:predicted HTH domain antitoxin
MSSSLNLRRKDQSDLSKAVRDLVTRGRISLAVERYQGGEVSLGKAAEVAGLSVGQLMVVLQKFGIKANIDQDDYRRSLENLTKVW